MTLLGLDVRDTSTIAVLVDEDGAVVAQESGAAGDPAGAARAVLDGSRRADAIGVSSADPSAVDASALGSALSARIPPAIVSPGAAIALAEQWCGAARQARHVVGLSAGETVTAGIVMNGRLFGGSHGGAGAVGWLALNPVEREDYRKIGCLEAEVGWPGIVRRLVWRIKAGDRSRALDLAGGNLNDITANVVFDAAREGDGVAISVVRDTAKYIGMAVANLIAILDPDVVVLGGAIADDLLLQPSRAELTRRVPPGATEVSVVPAPLGDAAAAVGAARAAMIAAQ